MSSQATPRRPLPLAAGLLMLLSSAALADPALVGAPATVKVEPADSALVGRRATRQLIATAAYPDGALRDLTRHLQWTSLNPEIARVDARGQVTPVADGTATIVAAGGSVEARTTVKVEAFAAPSPVSFRRDVVPALSQAGCNMGACHGTPTGKGGFGSACAATCPTRTSPS